MKKIFLAAVAMTAIFASCSKETEPVTNHSETTADSPQVLITFTTEESASRSFFDNTATAESWEKEINSMSLYVFNSAGNPVLRRDFTPAELASKSATFSLPNEAAGMTCDFYVVANTDYGTIVNKSAMIEKAELTPLSDYNGTTAVVMNQTARTDGFVMNGHRSTTIADKGSVTNVALSIKRVVAKVAVRATIAPELAQKYGGTVFIESATIWKVSSASYSYFNPLKYPDRGMVYSHEQVSGTNGAYKENLFYIYENDELAVGERLTLTLKGKYDADSNATTTYDQMDVSYDIELTGIGNGKILRNGYYRIEANIQGLSGDGVVVTFTVAEWELPVTQSVNLGS